MKKLRSNPMSGANALSLVFFWWMNGFFELGSKRTLEEIDMFEPLAEDRSEELCSQLRKQWCKELNDKENSRKPSLLRAIIRTYRKRFVLDGIFAVIAESTRTAMPVLIAGLIRYFENRDSTPVAHAYAYATAICICVFVGVISVHHLYFRTQRIGWHLRAAACALMYEKTLRLSQKALNLTTTGQIVNLAATDVIRFDLVPMRLHYLFIAPMQCIVFAVILWREVGLATLGGFGLLIPIMAIQTFNGYRFGKLRNMIAVLTDDRIRLMNEVICGIRIIKMYAWEVPFSKLVSEKRRVEIKRILHSSILKAVNFTVSNIQDKVLTFATLVVYSLLGGSLTASKIFFVANVFVSLQASVAYIYPVAMLNLYESVSSVKRIQEYLLLEEISPSRSDQKNGLDVGAVIEMKNYGGKWESVKDEKHLDRITLSGINVHVSSSQLLAVIGPVGSGKSSFLNAILGELRHTSGNVTVKGKVAYADQTPWVFSGTIRENIVFGQKYDPVWYKNVISACCLTKDLNLFTAGDMTLVGERGVTLSGGQKARVNLARVAYRRDADICLLDDPISAVDASVASHIFNQCISKLMHNKVRVLVTHQLQLLKSADQIIIIQEGKITGKGTYDELHASGTNFAALLQKKTDVDCTENATFETRATESFERMSLRASTRSTASVISFGEMPQDPFAGIEREEIREQGSVDGKVYMEYFRVGANAFYLILLFVVSLMSHGLYFMTDWWLAIWAQKYESFLGLTKEQNVSFTTPTNASVIFESITNGYLTSPGTFKYGRDFGEFDNEYYTKIYAVFSLSTFAILLLRAVMHFYLCVISGVHMHEKMFQAILRAPVRFFDTNPVGRILNRFSKDTGQVDELLPLFFLDTVFIFGVAVSVVILVSVVNYFVLIIVVPLLVYFVWLRRYYLRTSRDIKRLEGTCRSPIFSLLSSTLEGLVTVRAFGDEDKFIERFHEYQDLHSASWFLFLVGSRWFALRIELMAAVFTSATTFACIIAASSLNINSGEVGLVLTYSVWMLGTFQYGVRQSAEVENLMTSVERIQQYYRIPPEGPAEISDKKPSEEWPSYGRIRFDRVSFSYYEGGSVVLKDISLEIKPKEKVGLVGRTGAGKTSFISSIFRLAELVDGGIYIDGILISEIGLRDLRSALSIIPQDPILFAGSLRRNLDPFDEYAEADLWGALERVQFKDYVAALPLRLLTELEESGSNLSVGQRQLVCLARAILKRKKILMIDEATANVDMKTDRLIQETIREHFKDCTVITIAHRINTVIDSDRVLVLDAGQVKEFDEPHTLLQNELGLFTAMVNSSGLAESETLREAAKKAYMMKRREQNQ